MVNTKEVSRISLQKLSNCLSISYFSHIPNRASMYLAVTEVAPFAEYTPRASNETPPARANTLSQSVSKAENPEPRTAPALLQTSTNSMNTTVQKTLYYNGVTTSVGCKSYQIIFIQYCIYIR